MQELVTGMQTCLGSTFIAACLQGSFAVGDWDAHSDVDFAVAVADEISDQQVQALQALHERIFNLPSTWAQHLEGSYFPQAILRDYTQTGKLLWYLDNGSRSLERSEHCNSIVVRWTVRQHGVSLAGPHPASLVDPIPVEALRQDIRSTLNDWGGQILAAPEHFNNRFYQGFIVLSYCRMLHDLIYGCTSSRRASAGWAKANLDPLLGRADRSGLGVPPGPRGLGAHAREPGGFPAHFGICPLHHRRKQENRMKFLIAGFGSIGRRHFRNLLALGERDILLYRSGKGTLPDDELSRLHRRDRPARRPGPPPGCRDRRQPHRPAPGCRHPRRRRPAAT